MDIVEKARLFAEAAHGDQKRKYTGEPYINHPIEVCRILITHGVEDKNILAAALLHDTIEDTDVTTSDIHREFGEEITQIVVDLTDKYTKEEYPMLNRHERKILETDRFSRACHVAQMIKAADIIDNTRSIIKYDTDFARVYIPEIKRKLSVMRIGITNLFHAAKSAVLEAEFNLKP